MINIISQDWLKDIFRSCWKLTKKKMSLQDYKVDCSKRNPSNRNDNDNIQSQDFYLRNLTLIYLSVLFLNFVNIIIDDQIYSENLNEYFVKKTKKCIKFDNFG